LARKARARRRRLGRRGHVLLDARHLQDADEPLQALGQRVLQAVL
jgi:hypothetical protein